MTYNKPLVLASFYIAVLFIIAFSFSACSTCGYSLKGGSLDPAAEKLKVDFFNNRASQVNPTLSQIFTEKLKDKYLRETRLKLNVDDPDVYLSGYISSYTVAPVGVGSNGQAQSSRLTIVVHVKYMSKQNPKSNFESDITQFTDFNATQSFSAVEATLVDDICNKLVQDIFNKTILDW